MAACRKVGLAGEGLASGGRGRGYIGEVAGSTVEVSDLLGLQWRSQDSNPVHPLAHPDWMATADQSYRDT